MHEQVFVGRIVEEALRHGNVEAVTIEVGELAPIPAAELERALSVTGWALTVRTTPATINCVCGFTGRPVVTDKGHDYTVFHCPRCEQAFPAIIEGKDVVLKDVTVR